MRSRSGNSLPTLMLTLPLVAIPLMAVFGVPQFVPVIASSVSEEEHEPDRYATKRSVGIGESIAPTTLITTNSTHSDESSKEGRLSDLFRPAGSKRPESRPIRADKLEHVASSGSRSSLTSTSSEVALTDLQKSKLADLFGTETGTPDFVELRSTDRQPPVPASAQTPRAKTPSRTSSSQASSADGLTWRRAVQRLNELGIHEFRLEPGRDLGEFYFACEFSQDRDSRITRRFEAEAAEPLLAVELVLRQIDEWTHRR